MGANHETNGNHPKQADQGKTVPLWIDNKEHISSITFPVTNADSGRTVHEAYGATPAIAVEAVESAQRAFLSWRNTKPWDRRQLLLRAADFLQERRQEVADLILLETPVPTLIIEMINIDNSIALLEELAGTISLATSGMIPHARGHNMIALVVKEPYGVHLGIAPWNASLFLALRAVLTPIACGNTAILKASEISPKIHNFIGRMLTEVGFPPGVLNVIQHRREDASQVIEAMIAHPAVKKVNFTGSTAVGKIVAGMAARYCKPTLMELGGKAPIIVCKDANLDEAAQAAIVGAYLHHGQICMSTDTVIAHESIAQELTEKMVSVSATWPMTSAVSEAGAAKTEILVQDALARGASLTPSSPQTNESSEVAKGTSVNLKVTPTQLRPTILTGVTPDMNLYHEECFGPTVSVLTFQTEDEAITLANESAYGLSSSIFSRNILRALKLARQIDAGAVHINSMTVHDEPQLPHGGMKSSGWGRFGVPWGLDEFLQLKTITMTSNDLVV